MINNKKLKKTKEEKENIYLLSIDFCSVAFWSKQKLTLKWNQFEYLTNEPIFENYTFFWSR